jgi:hypothetical protein
MPRKRAKSSVMANNVPPKVIKRNEFGLIEGLDYVFQENGMIDWRRMVDNKYIVPNRDNTGETDVTKLKDKDLIILLAGLKDVASIRGYHSVTYNVVEASQEYVCASCSIVWAGNYETEKGESVLFQGMADAGLNNTDGFGQIYLAAIAENRAFCRAVRNFLRINIVAKEEIAPNKTKQLGNNNSSARSLAVSPDSFLLSVLKENNITFEQVKKKMISEKVEEANNWNSTKDIPRLTVFEIIQRIQSKK